MAQMNKPEFWCDHCNAYISLSGVRGCTRKTCQTKPLLEKKD